jgi:hypothetical protein
MALEYNIEIDGDLMTVTTRGYDDSIDEAVSYGELVIGACVESQCRKILVDESEMTGVLDKVGQFEMVKRLLSLVPYDLNIAFVVNPAFYEETSFGTMVAENRGIHVKAFTSEEDASEWLQVKI